MRGAIIASLWAGSLLVASCGAAAAASVDARSVQDKAILWALKNDQLINQTDDVALQLTLKIERADVEIASLKRQGRDSQRLVGQQVRDIEKLLATVSAKDRVIAAFISQLRGDLDALMAAPGGTEAIVLVNKAAATGALADARRAEGAMNAVTEARIRASEEAGRVRQTIAHAGYRRQEAQSLLGISPIDTSIRRYEAITAIDGRHVWDWVALARLYGKAGRVSKAAKAAERAATLATDRLAAAEISLEAGRANSALRRHSEANIQFYQAYGVLRAMSIKSPADSGLGLSFAKALYELTANELRFGRLAQANNLLVESRARLPVSGHRDKSTEQRLADAYLFLAHGKTMAHLCNKGFTAVFAEKMPFDQFAARCVGTAHSYLKSSIDGFEPLRLQNPANTDVLTGLASAHFALATLMTDAVWFQVGGDTAAAQPEFEATKALYAQVRRLAPQYAMALYDEAIALTQYERWLRLYHLDADALAVNREVYQLLNTLFETDDQNYAAMFDAALTADRAARIYFSYSGSPTNIQDGIKFTQLQLEILDLLIARTPKDVRAQNQRYVAVQALAQYGTDEHRWRNVLDEIHRLKALGMWPDGFESDLRKAQDQAARERVP